MTGASLVWIDHIGNWSRIVLEQCFYDWKLFRGEIKFSCCYKSHSCVAWSVSPNRFEPEEFITMTLKISKPVNEPLSRVFQTVLLLLMRKKKPCMMKHAPCPIQEQTYDASQVCSLFTARNSTDTAKKPDKYTCQRGTRRVFVTSGFVSCCLSQPTDLLLKSFFSTTRLRKSLFTSLSWWNTPLSYIY